MYAVRMSRAVESSAHNKFPPFKNEGNESSSQKWMAVPPLQLKRTSALMLSSHRLIQGAFSSKAAVV